MLQMSAAMGLCTHNMQNRVYFIFILKAILIFNLTLFHWQLILFELIYIRFEFSLLLFAPSFIILLISFLIICIFFEVAVLLLCLYSGGCCFCLL